MRRPRVGKLLGDEFSVTLRIIRTSRVTTAGLVIVVVFLVTAVITWVTNDALLPFSPYAISNQLSQPISWPHIFGTDDLGRDVFSQVIAATPNDAKVPFAVLGIAVAVGLSTGTVAGYIGGVVEDILMRVTDIFLAFPGIVLALGIAASIGPGINDSILALAPVWWPVYARLSRGETLSVKSQQYVEASRASGHRSGFVIIRHIIPNITPTLLVYATLDFGAVLLTFSILSFIGLGAQPPTPEWGLMAYIGEPQLTSAPWISVFPALAIFVVAIGFSLLGDGLRDALDPKVRGLFTRPSTS